MSSPDPHRVLIAGAGVAGLELLIALSRLAGDRVAITLLTPGREFTYRPLTVGEPFGRGKARRYKLAEIAHRFGATLEPGALENVDPVEHAAVTDSGRRLDYDSLAVTVGGTPRAALEGVTTFGLDRDPEALSGLLLDVEQGYSRRIAFVIPDGSTWPMPMYELALMTAAEVTGMGVDDVQITLVTPETAPLAIFGSAASATVSALLDEAGIEVIAGARAESDGKGRLKLGAGTRTLTAERIVALPVLDGPGIAGLPADEAGFLPVDEHGRVEGVEDVYAAGDGTAFPVKQGGLATQQADAVAEVIAARVGVDIEPEPYSPVLRGMLLTGGPSQYMTANLVNRQALQADWSLWWPPTKIAGRHLAPFLAERDDSDDRRPAQPAGIPIEVALPAP